MLPTIAWRMAVRDPARARRLADESQRYDDSPQTCLYLACGLKKRDPAAAEAAFWKGIGRIEEGTDYLNLTMQYWGRVVSSGPGELLPVVEQIDPTLVPEVFWRALTARLPIDDPRSLNDRSLSQLVLLLAWYDRAAAEAVFETDRAIRERTDDRDLASMRSQFLSWLLLDPRAAVAGIEQLRATPDLDAKAILDLRENLGLRLGRSYEDLWRSIWAGYGYGHMKDPLEWDIW